MSNKMRTKPRYSFQELEAMRRRFNINAGLTINLSNQEGRARSLVMQPAYEKSYHEDQELLDKARQMATDNFETNDIMKDYIIGYNIALEEESLDQDILVSSQKKINQLEVDMGIIGILLTSLLHLIVNAALFLFISQLEAQNSTYLLAVFLPVAYNMLILLLKQRIFKEGIKDGARFGGKLNEKTQKIFSSSLYLGTLAVSILVLAIGVGLFPIIFMTEASFMLSEVVKFAVAVVIFVIGYLLSYFNLLNKTKTLILALLISIIFAIWL